MDFFESMAMSGGDPAVAAGMHTAANSSSERPTPAGRRGPPPPGVTIPPHAYAIYSRSGKYLGGLTTRNDTRSLTVPFPGES